MTAVQENVEVRLLSGERKKVAAATVIGAYAVHLRVTSGRAVGPGWVVTHKASGILVWVVEQYDQAVKVATWLKKERALPDDAKSLEKWREGLSLTVNDKLFMQLSTIAPRFYPPHPGDDPPESPDTIP